MKMATKITRCHSYHKLKEGTADQKLWAPKSTLFPGSPGPPWRQRRETLGTKLILFALFQALSLCSVGAYVWKESPLGIFCWKQATALDMSRGL